MLERGLALEELARFDIRLAADVVRVRQAASDLAATIGFGKVDQTRIATAVSEIARNVLQHSGTTGTAALGRLQHAKSGIVIEIEDHGCGIPDIAAAMRDGYSTSVTSLGAGLPGSRRLMDEFGVDSAVGRGTVVRMTKWLPRR